MSITNLWRWRLVCLAVLVIVPTIQADLDLTTATWDMSSVGWGLGGNLALDDDLATRSTCVGHALPPDPTATSTNEWLWVDLGSDLQLTSVAIDFQLSAAIDYTIRLLTEAEGTALGLTTDGTAGGGVDNWTTIATAVGLPDTTPPEGEEDLSNARELAGYPDVWNFETGTVTIPDVEAADPNAIMTVDALEPIGRYLLIDSTLVTDDFWGNVSIWEIDVIAGTPTAPEAKNPWPRNGATDVSVLTDLGWRPGVEVESQTVYFGDDPNAMTDVAAGDGTLETVDNETIGGPLAQFTTYYWQVVSVKDPNTYPGAIWSFTTEPGEVTNISPADGAVHVVPSANPVLVWDGFDGVSSYNVLLGTSSGSLVVADNVTAETVTLSGTLANTMYYWQIEALDAGGSVIATGPEWSFTTGGPHYWPLDEGTGATAADTVGNNDGTLAVGMDWVVDAERGTCLEFDGVTTQADNSAGMLCGDIPLRQRSFSVALWAKRADTVDGYEVMVASGEFGLYLTPAAGQLLVNFMTGNVSVANVTGDTEWHHLVVVYDYDAGTAKVFKDGVQVYNGPAGPWANPLGGDDFRIGGRWSGLPYNGRIDDVRLYDYVLTDIEAMNLYLNTSDATYVCESPPIYDYSGDCQTNIADLAIFGAEWLTCGRYPATECGL